MLYIRINAFWWWYRLMYTQTKVFLGTIWDQHDRECIWRNLTFISFIDMDNPMLIRYAIGIPRMMIYDGITRVVPIDTIRCCGCEWVWLRLRQVLEVRLASDKLTRDEHFFRFVKLSWRVTNCDIFKVREVRLTSDELTSDKLQNIHQVLMQLHQCREFVNFVLVW